MKIYTLQGAHKKAEDSKLNQQGSFNHICQKQEDNLLFVTPVLCGLLFVTPALCGLGSNFGRLLGGPVSSVLFILHTNIICTETNKYNTINVH